VPDEKSQYEEDLSVGGSFRLGKRAPARKATLQVGEFLTVQEIPEHPPASSAPNIRWTMDRNDEAGDCVVAGVNHALQTIATNLGLPRQPWTDAELLELYRTQNPDFRDWSQGGSDADQGMVIQTFLEECVQRGYITAFAQIDHENHELMRAATFIGGAIVTGEVLRTAHEDLKLWDASKTGIWGGHCTATVAYGTTDLKQFGLVTWGRMVPYTEAFAERHMDEAWLILTPAMINNPGFRNNFDLRGFADAIAELTNGKVIVPVPPLPPTPPPVPPPGDNPPPVPVDPAWDDFPFADMDEWAKHPRKGDSKHEKLARLAYLRWKADHNVDQRNASSRRAIYDSNGRYLGEIELGTGQFWSSQG
jgi:hypothetical protein